MNYGWKLYIERSIYIATKHKMVSCSSNDTKGIITDKSVGLVITSPPYPMIQMWDICFSSQSPAVENALKKHKYEDAFEEMHIVLDKTWEDIDRVLIDGGVVCVNVGDANRNCDGCFKMFSNHSRIIAKFLSMGYDVLPDIHWRKPTNAPNKFMGSGMYPPCAYVTYEHEYILIFRKGMNRIFSAKEKKLRHQSAYFWEERNIWFSDLWDLNGVKQQLKETVTRDRSAAFPFELAYRLINMYSIKEDLVYDPFAGTGTVMKAAMLSERNSINVEIDTDLCQDTIRTVEADKKLLNTYIDHRIQCHLKFLDSQPDEKKAMLYQNSNHPFKVKTKQETEILISFIRNIIIQKDKVVCEYEKMNL